MGQALKKLVCVIDDDARIREAVCDILGRAGFETVQAADGDAGLEVVAREHPQVVVTDIIMPNREGIETIQMLKERFPDIGVLAISGSYSPGSVDFLEMAQCLGADDCLAKPFKPADLVSRVSTLAATR